MVKVSVIIPVYNVEKYLSQCLDSVVKQTLKDIEIICINDGSTDSSADILNKYAAQDRRIKIINQENQGISVARNSGIAAAKGEYIIFLDSDDFIEPTLAQKAYDTITKKKSDVLIFGTYEVNQNNCKNVRWDMTLLKDFYAEKFETSEFEVLIHLLHSVWDKMYNTAFIKKSKLTFHKGLKVAEDNIFVMETYFEHASYSFLPECLYNYRTSRAGSLTTNNKDCILNQFTAFKCMEKTALFKNQNLQTKLIVINQFLDGCIWLIGQSSKVDKKQYISQIKNFVSYLIKTYSKSEIKKIPNYGKIRKLIREKNSFWENIFSIRNSNDRRHKVLTILWMKFKFLRKKSKQNVPVDIFAHANKHSVLIFESQPHHGECLPAYIKYFNDLGYHVDLLLLHEIIEQNPFCRMPENADFNIIEGTWDNRAKILNNPKIMNYKHILIATAICYYLPQSPVIAEFPVFKKHPSVYIVEHDLHDIDTNQERSFLEKNRVSVLWKFKQGTMVNPCYFGNVKVTPKNVPTFVVVGKIEKKRKNHDLLFKTVENLYKRTQNFHVIIIGEVEDAQYSIPEELKPYITITGYLNFPEMYEYMEKADFFLPLLDPNNKAHERYLQSGVTGSLQLILGFRKIPLIQEKFAKFYEFSSENAIIYEDNLEEAMLKAIELTPHKYTQMQENLDLKAIKIFAQSEKNLRRMIS